MKNNDIQRKSLAFSKRVVFAYQYLCNTKKEFVLSKQFLRSGTSIGANIREAQYAQGKKDFISKLEIALKEASETGYWLELLLKTNYIDTIKYREFDNNCSQIRVMLIKSINTAKGDEK